MRNTLLFILLFSLTSCGDSEEQAIKQEQILQEAQAIKAEKAALLEELKAKDLALTKARAEAKDAKTKLLAQEEAKKEAFVKEERRKATEKEKVLLEKSRNEKLSNVGIEMNENKIVIDTNKTKDFFQNLGKTFENKILKFTQDLEKGVVSEKEAGIKIDESHINIDLNKTKDFLEKWTKKMQSFIKEFDTISKDLDTQTDQKTH